MRISPSPSRDHVKSCPTEEPPLLKWHRQCRTGNAAASAKFLRPKVTSSKSAHASAHTLVSMMPLTCGQACPITRCYRIVVLVMLRDGNSLEASVVNAEPKAL